MKPGKLETIVSAKMFTRYQGDKLIIIRNSDRYSYSEVSISYVDSKLTDLARREAVDLKSGTSSNAGLQ